MKRIIFTQTKNRCMISVTTRQFLLSVCFIAFACASFSQDLIVTKDSKKIEAKVTEINVDNVKYKVFTNQDGPVYTLPKSSIQTIVFQNGQVETFEDQTTSTSATRTPSNFAGAQPTPATQPTQPRSQTTTSPAAPAQQRTQVGYSGARRLSTAETLAEMQINYPALFSQYNAGRRMKSAGWTLTGLGIGALVLGTAVGVAGQENYDVEQEEAGAIIAATGVILVATGIPILAVGAGKRRRALKAFNNQYYATEQPASRFQINLHPNSIGLAYVF
ncbi:MAG: hypothetical protein LBE79_12015 [Tannerella sp.]|nr:hypothetical protein [Tannerella sp.]